MERELNTESPTRKAEVLTTRRILTALVLSSLCRIKGKGKGKFHSRTSHEIL
jgi:hypothetical protein